MQGVKGATKNISFFFVLTLERLKFPFTFALRSGNGPVVQLVRIQACHAWGRGFESRPDRSKKTQEQMLLGFFIPLYQVLGNQASLIIAQNQLLFGLSSTFM